MWAEAQDCEEEETILAVAFQDVLGCETRAEWGWGGKCSQDGRWASAYFSFASLESEPYIIPPHTWQIKCQLSNQVLSTFFLLNSEAIYIFTILSCLPVFCEAVPLLHTDCCACALHIFFSSSFSFTYLFFSRIVRFFFFFCCLHPIQVEFLALFERPLSYDLVTVYLSELNSEALSKPVCFLKIFLTVLKVYNFTLLRTP